MAEIADRVGVRKASLYNYYASKAELLLDLLGRGIEAWEAAAHPALVGPGTCRERLGAHLAAAVSFARTHPQTVAILRTAATQIGGDLGRRASRLIDERELRWFDILEGFFREALERGEVRDADPRDLALFWSALLDGVLVHHLLRTSKARRLGGALECLAEFFWRGAGGVATGAAGR